MQLLALHGAINRSTQIVTGAHITLIQHIETGNVSLKVYIDKTVDFSLAGFVSLTRVGEVSLLSLGELECGKDPQRADSQHRAELNKEF